MSNISYRQVGVFTGVAISVNSISNGKKIKMNEVAAHEFEVDGKTVKVPLHWFYPKALKNAEKGKRPVFVKMHFYSRYLKSVLENGKTDKKNIVRIEVSRKYRDKEVSDIILDVYPERHDTKVKFDLVFSKTDKRAITVPNTMEKICFLPRNKK